MLECEVICVDRLLCHRLFFTVRLDFNNQMSHHQHFQIGFGLRSDLHLLTTVYVMDIDIA